MSGARHLYVHLPFCAHRCGYCDFVTVAGHDGEHGALRRRAARRARARARACSARSTPIFLGGGTPTFTEPAALARLLAGLPHAAETTVEANPETVTPGLAALLREHGVNRVSLGAQSFQPHLLETLERRARPDDVRAAVRTLREAGFDNVSLDLIYGIPGQSVGDLERDLAEAIALEPEHLSCYELEAKPGTRFTHAHGEELERQAEAMEDYFERVVETLTGAGYRWYETANFCRLDAERDLRSQHNLGYWLGHDYLGLGVGAVSTVGGARWRNAPSLPRYLAPLQRGERPRASSSRSTRTCRRASACSSASGSTSRCRLAGLDAALDRDALARLEHHGLVAGRRRHARAHPARPLPRRRRHGRAARLSSGSSSTRTAHGSATSSCAS